LCAETRSHPAQIHLGTGNYNDITAGIYPISSYDLQEGIGADATDFFNMLSGYSAPMSWRKLIMAPFWLRNSFARRIEREKNHALQGKPARIIAKLNSLVDPELIASLYEASRAGVRIDLIVRGICCLRPGVPGLSETITVRSIVGRFLEHSRIYYFANDNAPDLFLSSADWMPRNLDRRVELMFPVEDETAWEKVWMCWNATADNERSWLMWPDGQYTRVDDVVNASGQPAAFCPCPLVGKQVEAPLSRQFCSVHARCLRFFRRSNTGGVTFQRRLHRCLGSNTTRSMSIHRKKATELVLKQAKGGSEKHGKTSLIICPTNRAWKQWRILPIWPNPGRSDAAWRRRAMRRPKRHSPAVLIERQRIRSGSLPVTRKPISILAVGIHGHG
jgi:hypothetical protein